jgi:hypothetical protein
MALTEAARAWLDSPILSAVEAVGSADLVVVVQASRPALPEPEVLDAISVAVTTRFAPASAALLVTEVAGPGAATPGEPPIPRLVLGPPRPGRPGILTALAAAQGLGARAVAVVEGGLAPAGPSLAPQLLDPIVPGQADFAAPAYSRTPAEGTLTSNLLAPLTWALYGRRLQQVTGGCAALSGPLLTWCLDRAPADAGWLAHSSEAWLTTEAVASGLPVLEVHLGRRPPEAAGAQPDLPSLVARTVGSVFALMEIHDGLWQDTRGSAPVARRGEPAILPAARPPDLERLVTAFRLGLKDLLPVWEQLMPESTLARLYPLGLLAPDDFEFAPALWARVVADFAIGYRERRMPREHLLRALTPLYLGRAAAFLRDTRGASPVAVARAFEILGQAFESEKERLVTLWR